MLLDHDRKMHITAEMRDAISRTAEYILATADYSRSDRLWAADAQIFLTNPLSIAYGACGTALLLHQTTVPQDLPCEALDWIHKQPLRIKEYPPGLYLGLAGIAWALQELGSQESAAHAMSLAYSSPLLYTDPTMLHGAAGWGLASLHLFHRTGRQEYLTWALNAGDYLADTAQHVGDTCHWPSPGNDPTHYGFGHGASGIALFLLYLHLLIYRSK